MKHSIKTVLVTGASSGIGLDVARKFLEKGSNLVLNAFSADKLARAAQSLGQDDKLALAPGDIADGGYLSGRA